MGLFGSIARRKRKKQSHHMQPQAMAARCASTEYQKMNRTAQAASASKKQVRAAMPEVVTARRTGAMPSFDDRPGSGWVRQSDLVRDPKHPTRPVPLPVSPATFWRWVRDGKFPEPTKLGKRITAWKVGEVRAWMAAQATV